MAIVLQKGMSKAYGQLGKLAGQAQASAQEQAWLQQAQAEARRFEFEQKKREMDHLWDIEAYNRAKAWEVEKASLSSQMEFEYETKKRLREREETDNNIRAIKDKIHDGEITQEQGDKMVQALELKSIGLDYAANRLFEPEKQITSAQLKALQQQTSIEEYLERLEQSGLSEQEKSFLQLQLSGKQAGVALPHSILEKEKEVSSIELERARKFLEDYEKKQGFFSRPTETEHKLAEYYQGVIDRAATGRNITSFDGTPKEFLPQWSPTLAPGTRYVDPEGNIRIKR